MLFQTALELIAYQLFLILILIFLNEKTYFEIILYLLVKHLSLLKTSNSVG